MDRLLIVVVSVSLGNVQGSHVRHRHAPATTDRNNQVFLDNLQKQAMALSSGRNNEGLNNQGFLENLQKQAMALSSGHYNDGQNNQVFLEDLQKQAMALSSDLNKELLQVNENSLNGIQISQFPALASVFTGAQSLIHTSTKQQNNNLDLSEVMRQLNASHNLPQVDSDTRAPVSEAQFLENLQQQVMSFSKIVNTDMNLWAEPKRIRDYFMILNNMSDPSIATGENRAAAEALQRRAQELMDDYQRKFSEAIKRDERSQPTVKPGSQNLFLNNLQQQTLDLASMYNREVSKAIRVDDSQNAFNFNLGEAVTNIFQYLGRP